jgi:hypothetical protein
LSLKKILKQLAIDGRYYAEMVDNLAEIYYLDDARPVVLAEYEKTVLHLNFRSDLTPSIVAQVSHDITKIVSNVIVGPCFAITADKGVVYGNEAMGAHYLNVYLALQSSTKDSEELESAIFVVKEPLETFSGKRQPRSDKIYKKLWEDR